MASGVRPVEPHEGWFIVEQTCRCINNHLAQTQGGCTQSNSNMALESVAAYRNIIEPYLDRPEDDHAGLIDQLRHQNEADSSQGQPAQFAAIETVFRDKFYELLATTEIF